MEIVKKSMNDILKAFPGKEGENLARECLDYLSHSKYNITKAFDGIEILVKKSTNKEAAINLCKEYMLDLVAKAKKGKYWNGGEYDSD